MLSPNEVHERMSVVPRWWGQIEVHPGIRTPGCEPFGFSDWKLTSIPPNDFKTALDVGAWDGYHSFRLREGGFTVTAVDSYQHSAAGMKGFEVARDLRRIWGKPVDQIEYMNMDAQDLSGLGDAKFDLVLAFGLIYHIQDPYKAMCQLARVTGQCMVLEGHVFPGDQPIGYFYSDRELNNDPTNFWGLTVACIGKMGQRAGFSRFEAVGQQGDRALVRFWK